MLKTADLWEHSRKLKILKGDFELDFPAVNSHKDRTVERLSKGVKGLLKKAKIASYQGTARLVSGTRVRVDGPDGVTELKTRAILLATGSSPRAIPGVDADEKRIVTSNGMLRLEQVPKRLVVLGAGAVGAP